MSKVFDYFFPITGAISGGFSRFNLSKILTISFMDIIEMIMMAIIFALIGGIVGYFVKKLLDMIFKKRE